MAVKVVALWENLQMLLVETVNVVRLSVERLVTLMVVLEDVVRLMGTCSPFSVRNASDTSKS